MMENPNGLNRDFFRVGTPLCGLVTGLLGVLLAFLLLFLGFWRTLLVALFFVGGFLLGANKDKITWIKSLINNLFPPKGE